MKTLVLLVLMWSTTGCSLLTNDAEVPDIRVGELVLIRHPAESLHYQLSLAVHNGTDRELLSFGVDGVASFELPGDVDGADSEQRDRQTANVSLTRRCNVYPGSAPTLELVFPCPFPFAPPVALELSDIRFHSFRLDDGSKESGEIFYPFVVKEN